MELVRIKSKNYTVSGDGKPVELSLNGGMKTLPGKGDIKVEFWRIDENKNEKNQFEWRCKVSVKGGGLATWRGENAFEFSAPSQGYREYDEIRMLKGDRWQNIVDRKYFIRTATGKYARISFSIMAGGQFFVVEGFYNPSGSPNLEFEPAKEIKTGSYDGMNNGNMLTVEANTMGE